MTTYTEISKYIYYRQYDKILPSLEVSTRFTEYVDVLLHKTASDSEPTILSPS